MDDYCDNDTDIGYAKLVDKHINKYQRVFEENDRKFNLYKPIDDNDNNDDQKKSCDGICLESEPEKQQQTLIINDDDIYNDLYKVWIHALRGRAEPTHVYTCLWCTCRYETTDYQLLKHHLYNEHIKKQLYLNYSRSFVSLNIYKYMCLRCDYHTKIYDNIFKHVYDPNHPKCLVSTCAQHFPTKVQLYEKKKRELLANLAKLINTEQYQPLCPDSDSCKSFLTQRQAISREKCETNQWKCDANACGKCFANCDQLTAHKKRHFCLFKLDSSEYLNGNGVCSFTHIKIYYRKRRVIDGSEPNKVEYRYLCQWANCDHETYNYNAIQRHIHDRHTCPFNE